MKSKDARLTSSKVSSTRLLDRATSNKAKAIEAMELQSTRCAICHTGDNASELYPANFDKQAFNPVVFSARRLPDRVHYRLVKCNSCGLVRSDPIAPPEVLARLYAQSSFDYTDQVANLKYTYGHYLAKLSKYGLQKEVLLEIGCGNGFFLEEALTQGYTTVRGIEPSEAAVAKANPQVQPNIICDIARSELFEPEQFDVICVFQTLDHMHDPGKLLDMCFRWLKPQGLVLYLNHNIEAISARLLKERSPIIDIEHTYLYSPATMRHLFSVHNFQIKEVGSVFNRYTLHYLVRLSPLPRPLKGITLNLLKKSPLGRIPVSLPLGNLYLIAQKPYHYSIEPVEATL